MFIEILESFKIETLVDIRGLPGSRKFPQFNKENLQISLSQCNINYIHLGDLGGHRKIHKDSKNIRWRNDSFRAYADYMETIEFTLAIKKLEAIAAQSTTSIMCAEALWWRCHRSMVADYLKIKGWNVLHILNKNTTKEHVYTSAARIDCHNLYYFD